MCDETSLCTFNGINVIYSSQIVIFHKSCNVCLSFQEIQCDPHKNKSHTKACKLSSDLIAI